MSFDAINSFFSLDLPCPPVIKNCNALRAQYHEELDKITNAGCSSCEQSSLKIKYIEQLAKESDFAVPEVEIPNLALFATEAPPPVPFITARPLSEAPQFMQYIFNNHMQNIPQLRTSQSDQ